MSVCGGVCKQILWLLVRLVFRLLRNLYWVLICRYYKIMVNYRSDSYLNTAHIQKIIARHKLDKMIQTASARDFLTVHACFINPEYVLSKNVTLYCLTKKTAYFVECDPEVDVTSSDVSPFFKIAQFNHAKNLIALPMHVFHKLGASVGGPKGQLVIITNCSRCGSTLLSQVFEETKACVSISEPDAFNFLATLSSKLSEPEMDKLMKTIVQMLCKNSSNATKCCVLKVSQNSTFVLPFICRVFPNVKVMFMYRDGLAVTKSVAKMVKGLPMLGALFPFTRHACTMKLAKRLTRRARTPILDFQKVKTLKSHLHIGSILWSSAMRNYLNFLASGNIDIVAVRYEDMVGDTDYALPKIFEYSGLPYNHEAVKRALCRDSQRGSPISQEYLGRAQSKDITDKIKKQFEEVSELFNVPSVFDSYIAENTITYRQTDREDGYIIEDEVQRNTFNMTLGRPDGMALSDCDSDDNKPLMSSTTTSNYGSCHSVMESDLDYWSS